VLFSSGSSKTEINCVREKEAKVSQMSMKSFRGDEHKSESNEQKNCGTWVNKPDYSPSKLHLSLAIKEN
jgi:hypothetical protein